MGVRALVPFIQKTCPDVIKKLPNRFQSLKGKTVVVDGTLITQRLHFAPVPHTYRHVLGWFRLMQEFRESGVNAICVFDGKQRSEAKQNEIERRRRIRHIDTARGLIESERLRRFGAISHLLASTKKLAPNERARVSKLLRSSIDRARRTPLPLCPTGPLDLDTLDKVLDRLAEDIVGDGPPTDALIDSLIEASADVSSPAPSDQQDLSAAFLDLYLDFRRSVSTLDVLPACDGTAAGSEEEQAQVAMSRAQALLAREEGAFWQSLVSEDDDMGVLSGDRLSKIFEKSTFMAESYLRRSSPPTDETYAESRSILNAMGVPVVVTSGPYEAEALASSMVLRGLADYVASEDTDVLVYEAPLIRNITTRKDPLVLIQGGDVRAALALSQASFIDFALLLGTDFAPRIRNVGPIRALRLIRAYARIENALQDPLASGASDTDAYLAAVRRARDVFNTLPPIPEEDEIRQGEYDSDKVNAIMMKFRLQRHVMPNDWDFSAPLAGNYFDDDPHLFVTPPTSPSTSL
ncbi:PIN domain-like protein [Vararia minispora EC-137]|uniref:PIN domain-like protein n=1 Tax=Vararia minispora EC-137 TaxID=1314806 RepID=A0ACB8QUJ0_9AGAM|nr:PIN domain-like protein [Vararia minispora EC-137]